MNLPALLPSTRLAIQATVAIAVAAIFVDITDLPRPYWVMLTAVLVMVGTVGETLTKSLDRILGTLLGLAAGAAIYWAASLVSFPGMVLLFTAIAGFCFLKFISYRLAVIAVSIALVILFRLGGANDAVLLARLYDTAIGAVIAGLVSVIVLPIPTRRPADTAIDQYVGALKQMVHDSLDAIGQGEWSGSIDADASRLRGTEAGFQSMDDALRAESVLFGGHGRTARNALAILPVLRGYADAVVDAAKTAAGTGLGNNITDELAAIDNQISANLDALGAALTGNEAATSTSLETIMNDVEAKIAPKLLESPETRRNVMTLQIALLACRRLNRGLRHAAGHIK